MAFETPALPYAYDALEPYIDAQTMTLHHDKHHVGYTTNLNNAIKGTEFEKWDIVKILQNLSSIPENIRTTVRNNGGGHANHALFWETMGAHKGGSPTGKLADAINSTFGSFDKFKEKFTDTATKRFGSGWAWLVVKKDKKLDVYSTANQDNPMMEGDTPILGLDVWEHAYYLKYQNRRPEYIAAFYNLINWEKVAANFTKASA
jgi:superoxide dismutase, Fe-Mn family